VIFHLEHISALLAEDALVDAIILLPMTFILNALRLDNISRATWDHLLQFSFFLLSCESIPTSGKLDQLDHQS
jgi:hypothetical protein